MISFVTVAPCALLALAFYAVVGLPLARLWAPAPLAPFAAPALGWAVHTPAALAIFLAAGLSAAGVAIVFIASFVVAIAALWQWRAAQPQFQIAMVVALGAALVLAASVAAGLMPKVSGAGVALSGQIFDHSKVAIVDEIARSGVPPVNPFFGESGMPPRLAYYYLWHFGAAELSLLTGAGGWAADAALTWFTAFASLSLMMGLAIWLSGRPGASLWVVLLAASASMRPLLNAAFGRQAVENIAGEQSGFGAWFFQTGWGTQHAASAVCVVLSLLMLPRLIEWPRLSAAALFALTTAAAFECSTWVGGVVLPPAAAIIALQSLSGLDRSRRWRAILHAGGAVLVALALVTPFVLDQLRLDLLRGGGLPIAVTPYDVLQIAPDNVAGRLLNMAAYWLIFLPVEFIGFYGTGLVALYWLRRERQPREQAAATAALAVMMFTGLGVSWLVASTLTDNNDLGWRAALPAVMALIVFAAIGLTRAARSPKSLVFAAALILAALGLPDGLQMIRGNVFADPSSDSQAFAQTPALWEAVRRHSTATERVANNPLFMQAMTPWGANISWALLSDRRSCFAAAYLAGPLSGLTETRQFAIEKMFGDVFSGDGGPEELTQMATRYNCNVIVVTPQDGAWTRDPFANGTTYRLVESTKDWRIYRAVKMASLTR